MSRQMYVWSSTKRDNQEEKYLGESESNPRGRQDTYKKKTNKYPNEEV